MHTIFDPCRAIEEAREGLEGAFNGHDPAGIAAWFDQQGTISIGNICLIGRTLIERYYADQFQKYQDEDQTPELLLIPQGLQIVSDGTLIQHGNAVINAYMGVSAKIEEQPVHVTMIIRSSFTYKIIMADEHEAPATDTTWLPIRQFTASAIDSKIITCPIFPPR